MPRSTVEQATYKLLIASLIAQVLVVSSHHFGMMVIEIGHPGAVRIASWIFRLVFGIGTVVFFVIAGYVFFNGFEKENAWLPKIKRRVRSLGVPYIIWNFIASPWFTAMFLPLFATIMPWLGDPRPVDFVDVFFGKAPSYFPGNAPLWFLRELFLVSLCSPLIWRLIRLRRGYLFVLACFVAWMAAFWSPWGWLECVAQAFFAFSLGGLWRIKGHSLFRFTPRAALWAMFAIVAMLAAEYIFALPANTFLGVKCVAGCVAALGAAEWLSRTPAAYWLAWLGEASFFIYLTHIIGRREVSKLIISIVEPRTELSAVLTMIAILAVIFIYTIGAWALLRRFAPRLLAFLQGGRSPKLRIGRSDSRV